MKTDWTHLEQARKLKEPMSSIEGDHFGAFFFPYGTTTIIIIASSGDEEIKWEHVSVRAANNRGDRIPTWEEMCWVKSLFWNPDECVVQYHPPESVYIDHNPFVLHLWKPIGIDFPMPPVECV